jgi:hypothetical protein
MVAYVARMRENPCPYCSLVVRFDDDNQTVHHELPACPAFLRTIALVAKNGGHAEASVTFQREIAPVGKGRVS